MNLFQASNITAGYGGETVIRSVSFESEAGSLLGVLGANGSGKTTLMKAICGIIPHEGECRLDEMLLEQLSARQISRFCSYIPQRSGISIDISVLDVVLMGFNPRLGLLEHPNASMKEAARMALRQAGLEERMEENYLNLSEGQKQLCILARTLVSESNLLLLDEPESALDLRHRYRMMEILKQWLLSGKRSAIVSLHDPELAMQYCDRLLLLKQGEAVGILSPQTDSLSKMEELLAEVYGRVCLVRCRDRQGNDHLVMLKEQEDVRWNL